MTVRTPGAAIVDVTARCRPAAAIAGGTLAAVVARGAIGGDDRAWPYLIVLSVLVAMVAMVATDDRLSNRTVTLLSVLAAVHAVGGLAVAPGETNVSLYEHWIVDGVVKVDQLAHAGGSMIITVAVAELLARWAPADRSGHRVKWALAALVACGIGALNECFEFLMAQRIDTLRIGDGANTGWDLVFNLAGALAAMTAAWAVGSDGVRSSAAASVSSSGRPVG